MAGGMSLVACHSDHEDTGALPSRRQREAMADHFRSKYVPHEWMMTVV